MKNTKPLNLLAGVVSGILVGYLTAPQTGQKTKRQLVDTLSKQPRRLISSAQEQWHKTVALAAEVVANVKTESGLFAFQTKATSTKKQREVRQNNL